MDMERSSEKVGRYPTTPPVGGDIDLRADSFHRDFFASKTVGKS
jgi:hypothetical protein